MTASNTDKDIRVLQIPVQVRMNEYSVADADQIEAMRAVHALPPTELPIHRVLFDVLLKDETVAFPVLLGMAPRLIESFLASEGTAEDESAAVHVAWRLLPNALSVRLIQAARLGAYLLDLVSADETTDVAMENALRQAVEAEVSAKDVIQALHDEVSEEAA